MKRVFIALGILFIIACRKTPVSVTPPTPVIIKKVDTLYSQSYFNQKSGMVRHTLGSD